jgi:Rrf2 family protein
MHNILRISEAAVLALHATELMSREPERALSASGLAAELKVSYNHLSKVMQRLSREGYVSPIRGPKGGFRLTSRAAGARLRDIIEAIEGPLEFSDCLMGERGCGKADCSFRRLLAGTNKRFEKLLSQKAVRQV